LHGPSPPGWGYLGVGHRLIIGVRRGQAGGQIGPPDYFGKWSARSRRDPARLGKMALASINTTVCTREGPRHSRAKSMRNRFSVRQSTRGPGTAAAKSLVRLRVDVVEARFTSRRRDALRHTTALGVAFDERLL